MNKAKLTGMVLAVGAAAAFALTPAISTAGHHKHNSNMVHCGGVNACKGKNSCKGTENACKGKNSCKGKGFVEMSKKQCEQVGGTAE